MDRITCDRMFIAVMETGSFAAAARRLGASSGQASKLVARLEGMLGVRLLNRSTRSVTATEIGQAYFTEVRRLIEDLDALDQSISDSSGNPRGRLRLTVPLTFGTMVLAGLLAEFAAEYPEIALEVDFSDRVASLVDEGYDAAVRIGHPEDSGLIGRKLCDMPLVTVAAPRYLDRAGRPEHPADLAEHAAILDRNLRDPSRWDFREGGAPVSVRVSGRISFANAEACLLAAERGLGIALVPRFVAEESLRAGRVEAILTDFADEPRVVHVLYPAGRHLAAKVRLLVDYLAAKLG